MDMLDRHKIYSRCINLEVDSIQVQASVIGGGRGYDNLVSLLGCLKRHISSDLTSQAYRPLLEKFAERVSRPCKYQLLAVQTVIERFVQVNGANKITNPTSDSNRGWPFSFRVGRSASE